MTTFTVSQLAERWSVSRNTIGRMIASGELKAFAVGKPRSLKARYRITEAEVERYESQSVKAIAAKSGRRLPSVKQWV